MILEKIEELKEFLNTPKKIVIVGHKNPDGDAVGSTTALKSYLDKKGHQCQVILPNEFPDFLKWMPETDKILYYNINNEKSKHIIKNSDIIFLLDFNSLHRIGDEMKAELEAYPNDFALIDHHQQPDKFKYRYSDTTICSTCQMVYHFIEMMNDLELIDKSIATSIYTGIMTDTGSFRFRSTTSTTHRIIAQLIDIGAENDRIHNNTNGSKSQDQLRLLGCALKNLKVIPEYSTAYITLSEKEKRENNFRKGYTDGIVNYALSVSGINFAIIFIEDTEQEIIKISFRSKGKFSVNQFSRNHFNGGGHDNAAGGKSDLTMEDTINEFEKLLPQYAQQINTSYDED